MSIKVALIFETAEQRELFVARLKPQPDVSVSAYTGGVRSLQAVMQKEKADVVLLAIAQPDDADFESIEASTLRFPGVMLLLVSEDSGMTTLKRAMRAGVRDVLPGPLTTETVKTGVDCARDAKSIHSQYVETEGAVFAFMPAKGGSGCTFLVTNLAYQLYKAGRRVLVIDLNLYFGDAATYLTERKSEASLVDMARQSRRLDASLLDASVLKVRESLHVLTAPDLPYQLEEVTPDTVAAIIGLAETQYDFVLLDLGRTMDPATVKALDLAERIHLVIGQSLPALHDAQRVVKVFEGLGYSPDKIQLVLNRFSKSSPIQVAEVERATRHKVARVVPASDEAVLTSINQGVALSKLAARDPVVRALQDWVQELSPVTVKPGKSWFATLTGGM
ncbi:AAA family ATPase [Hydrogenophaga sp.]|uniref:AAA family ATPase n=1 Tax=Hydrogenophaga sp. TaxID=1904254 RepID=UPI0027204DBA|nr:AAA family ATPase [Hydrogenophaga sp.]MDO9605573.1 AAA family ATPase [Hydrogenophaga sp.]